MTAEQLEELLGKVTQGEWQLGTWGDNVFAVLGEKWTSVCRIKRDDEPVGNSIDHHDATLIALAPSLARRVIAAEKLVEALTAIADGDGDDYSRLARAALTAYREASK